MTANRAERSILIIDDDPAITGLATTILKEEGYHVLVANSGAGGLALATEHRPSIILMDIGLPGMDGYETTIRLKEILAPSTVPIIFISGRTASEDGGRAFALGGISYLRKPFRPQQLRDLVNLTFQSVKC